MSGGRCVGWSLCRVAIVSGGRCVGWSLCPVVVVSGGHCVGWSLCRVVVVSGGRCGGVVGHGMYCRENVCKSCQAEGNVHPTAVLIDGIIVRTCCGHRPTTHTAADPLAALFVDDPNLISSSLSPKAWVQLVRGQRETPLTHATIETHRLFFLRLRLILRQPPPQKNSDFIYLINVSWLLDTRNIRCYEKKILHKFFSFAKGYRTMRDFL